VEITGLTACGRATVSALSLNNQLAVIVRRNWIKAGWHRLVLTLVACYAMVQSTCILHQAAAGWRAFRVFLTVWHDVDAEAG
jgi:hypothetical protein